LAKSTAMAGNEVEELSEEQLVEIALAILLIRLAIDARPLMAILSPGP
jgi:hypothetical protein